MRQKHPNKKQQTYVQPFSFQPIISSHGACPEVKLIYQVTFHQRKLIFFFFFPAGINCKKLLGQGLDFVSTLPSQGLILSDLTSMCLVCAVTVSLISHVFYSYCMYISEFLYFNYNFDIVFKRRYFFPEKYYLQGGIKLLIIFGLVSKLNAFRSIGTNQRFYILLIFSWICQSYRVVI